MRGAIRHYGTTTRPFDGSKPDFGLKVFLGEPGFLSAVPGGPCDLSACCSGVLSLRAKKCGFNGPVPKWTSRRIPTPSRAQWRGPLSSTVTTKSGDIFGGSCRLQSGHGMPGAPHPHARAGSTQLGNGFQTVGIGPVKRNWPGNGSNRANPRGSKAGDLRATQPEYLPFSVATRDRDTDSHDYL